MALVILLLHRPKYKNNNNPIIDKKQNKTQNNKKLTKPEDTWSKRCVYQVNKIVNKLTHNHDNSVSKKFSQM